MAITSRYCYSLLGRCRQCHDEQLVAVLYVEEPTITDTIGHPDHSAVFGSFVNGAPVALHTAPEKGDDVSALEGCPQRHLIGRTTALSHFYMPFLSGARWFPLTRLSDADLRVPALACWPC